MKLNFLQLVTLGSLAGSFAVSSGYPVLANSIWSIVNIPLVFHNHKIGQTEQRNLFIAFELIAVYGLIREFLL